MPRKTAAQKFAVDAETTKQRKEVILEYVANFPKPDINSCPKVAIQWSTPTQDGYTRHTYLPIEGEYYKNNEEFKGLPFSCFSQHSYDDYLSVPKNSCRNFIYAKFVQEFNMLEIGDLILNCKGIDKSLNQDIREFKFGNRYFLFKNDPHIYLQDGSEAFPNDMSITGYNKEFKRFIHIQYRNQTHCHLRAAKAFSDFFDVPMNENMNLWCWELSLKQKHKAAPSQKTMDHINEMNKIIKTWEDKNFLAELGKKYPIIIKRDSQYGYECKNGVVFDMVTLPDDFGWCIRLFQRTRDDIYNLAQNAPLGQVVQNITPFENIVNTIYITPKGNIELWRRDSGKGWGTQSTAGVDYHRVSNFDDLSLQYSFAAYGTPINIEEWRKCPYLNNFVDEYNKAATTTDYRFTSEFPVYLGKLRHPMIETLKNSGYKFIEDGIKNSYKNSVKAIVTDIFGAVNEEEKKSSTIESICGLNTEQLTYLDELYTNNKPYQSFLSIFRFLMDSTDLRGIELKVFKDWCNVLYEFYLFDKVDWRDYSIVRTINPRTDVSYNWYKSTQDSKEKIMTVEFLKLMKRDIEDCKNRWIIKSYFNNFQNNSELINKIGDFSDFYTCSKTNFVVKFEKPITEADKDLYLKYLNYCDKNKNRFSNFSYVNIYSYQIRNNGF